MANNTLYRALRMYNGGEKVEFAHFQTIKKAYDWLIPTIQKQHQERWHIKVLPVIQQTFETEKPIPTYISIGFNELLNSDECTVYIQLVDHYDDPLPNF